MKPIALVATDLAPSQAFGRVIELLNARHLELHQLICNGKILEFGAFVVSALRESLTEAGVVLIGMSSSIERAQIELFAAITALRNQIPYGFYADNYNTWNRSWFSDVLKNASFLFVINEEEKEKVIAKFPDLNVIVSGNPMWEEFHFPKYTREQVRQKLGLGERETIILSPGIKSPVVNIRMWSELVDTLYNDKVSGTYFHLLLAPHPGDPTPLSVYDDLIKYSPIPTEIITREIMSSSDILPGIDVLVECGSTLAIEAAHLRKLVISFFTPLALARLEKMTGSREWEPCNLGVSEKIVSSNRMGGLKIKYMLAECDQQRSRQKVIYINSPKKGTAVNNMISTLMKFLQ